MFCLSGIGSTLSCEVFPPYDVSDGFYEIGLVDLSTYNSIPNIEKGVNDKFYYGKDDKEIVISEGSYEIEDIERYIKSKLGTKATEFSLRANNNTLKAELKFSEQVNFEKPNTIASLLGFSGKILEPKVQHESVLEVDIVRVNTIRVECNIVRGSYKNGIEGHVIHEFYPTSAPGYKIVESPRTVIYLPINCQRINNITVSLKDQSGNPINLRNENLTLRLHVRKIE